MQRASDILWWIHKEFTRAAASGRLLGATINPSSSDQQKHFHFYWRRTIFRAHLSHFCAVFWLENHTATATKVIDRWYVFCCCLGRGSDCFDFTSMTVCLRVTFSARGVLALLSIVGSDGPRLALQQTRERNYSYYVPRGALCIGDDVACCKIDSPCAMQMYKKMSPL